MYLPVYRLFGQFYYGYYSQYQFQDIPMCFEVFNIIILAILLLSVMLTMYVCMYVRTYVYIRMYVHTYVHVCDSAYM